MTEAEFAAYATDAVPTYAREKVLSGEWTEGVSVQLAQDSFTNLLPQGVATPGNCFYTIRDTGKQTAVGVLWFAVKERAGKKIAYVYDIQVKPAHQRKGHARRALSALETEVRELGLSGIALHVFGHNTAAQALYNRLGYRPTNLNLFKSLGR